MSGLNFNNKNIPTIQTISIGKYIIPFVLIVVERTKKEEATKMNKGLLFLKYEIKK